MGDGTRLRTRRRPDAEKVAGVGGTERRDMEWNRMAPRGQGAEPAPIFTGFKTSDSHSCLLSHLPILTLAYSHTCPLSHLPNLTFACSHICLLSHLYALTFAYSHTCLLSHLPTFTLAYSHTCQLSRLPTLTFVYLYTA